MVLGRFINILERVPQTSKEKLSLEKNTKNYKKTNYNKNILKCPYRPLGAYPLVTINNVSGQLDWPWGKYECEISMGSWTYTSSQIDLKPYLNRNYIEYLVSIIQIYYYVDLTPDYYVL